MRIDGGCHCGKITYEAEVDPDRVVICHCTDCQTISGAPYRASVRVKAGDLELHGEPATYVKKGDSGNEIRLAFCAGCGSALYSTAVKSARGYMLRLGSINQRAALTPKAQGFCRSAMPWAMDIRGIPEIGDGR
jgi:hypothetical protein